MQKINSGNENQSHREFYTLLICWKKTQQTEPSLAAPKASNLSKQKKVGKD